MGDEYDDDKGTDQSGAPSWASHGSQQRVHWRSVAHWRPGAAHHILATRSWRGAERWQGSRVRGLASGIARFFPYDFDRRYAFIWRLLGAKPATDGVTISDDERLVATYGRKRVDTPVANVSGAHITEGYRWWTAVGTRLSLADDGLTFGTNARRGVCLHFAEKIPKILGFRNHSALTVTVSDCEGLVEAVGGDSAR